MSSGDEQEPEQGGEERPIQEREPTPLDQPRRRRADDPRWQRVEALGSAYLKLSKQLARLIGASRHR